MSGTDYLRIWYRAQVSIALFCVAVIGGWEFYHHLPFVPWMIIMAVILVLALVAEANDLPRWLQAVNRWIQCLIQPIILVVVWAIMTREIIVRLQLPPRGVMVITMTYYVVMFAPMAGIIGGQLQWTLARLFYPFWWFSIVTGIVGVIYPAKFAGPHLFALILQTGALGALALFLMMVAAMRAWHLSWPGINPQFGRGFSWLSLAILLGLGGIFIFINAFSSGDSVKNILTSYSFANFHPNREYLLTAFEAGVAEETLCRFGSLGVCLYALRNFRWQILGAVLLTSALFGALHLGNLVEQPLAITILQTISAFGLGLYFAVVYLYTGQLWLAMLLHFLLDWLAFSTSGSTAMMGNPTLADWYLLAVEVLFFTGITIWMFLGDRYQVMERHARRLTGENQRFGYRLTFE